MNHIVYIALGSNLGQRMENLRSATAWLEPQIHVVVKSAVYETEPWGYADQPAFLNMALRAETDLSPSALLAGLKEIESSLGRTPSFRNGPRLIDLDIIFYDDILLDSLALTIPHPRLHERAFVLIPLAEIAPGFIHPGIGLSVEQLAANVGKKGIKLFPG